ncbi:MAG: hypothetical protein ACLTYN_11660 [Dysosmobacter welbionis]
MAGDVSPTPSAAYRRSLSEAFTPETIHRLERLRWWDWPREKLQLPPLLRW